MDRQILNFTANEQILVCDNPIKISTNKVNYIEARFDLGQNWTGYDSVRAVWFNDFQCISTVLDSQGVTFVPFEVMKRRGNVKVNLVGSISEDDVLTDRLTSYPVVAVIVDCIAQITGANTSPITPSEYEQFVASVRNDADRAEQGASDAEQSAQNAENYASDAEDARDEIRNMSANATTLPSGSDATASYSDGVLSLGIPKGDKGDTGVTGATPSFSIGTVETLEPTESATATITGTDENPVLNLGLPKGEQGEVSLDELSALLPTDTASGSIASFPDGTDLVPAKSLKVTLEPIQSGSGTPSPDNVRPISGHTECVTEVCGKNLFDDNFSDWESIDDYLVLDGKLPSNSEMIMSLVDKDTSVDISGLYLGFVNAYTGGAPVNYRWIINNGTISGNKTNSVHGVLCNQLFLYPKTEDVFNKIKQRYDIQVELGTTATDYEPYQGDTYTTTLGRTVYGGTLDVVSGELVVDRAMVDLGSLNWRGIGLGAEYARFVSSDISSTVKTPPNNATPTTAICEQYSAIGASNLPSNNGTFGVYTDGDIGIKDESYADVASFKSAMNGVQLVYELATPQTYQLDPQTIDLLLGQNNLWTDCGSVEVTYKADVGLYIDKKLG